MQSKQVDKAPHFIMKLKTIASDCEIKKDVTTMPLLIYYGGYICYFL